MYIRKLAKQETIIERPCSITDQPPIQLGTGAPLLGPFNTNRHIDVTVMMKVKPKIPARASFFLTGSWLRSDNVRGIKVTTAPSSAQACTAFMNVPLTQNIRRQLSRKLIFDGFVLAKPRCIGTEEEGICEKTADVSQYRITDDDPPSSPIKLQAFGEVVVECEKGTFYSPESGKE